MRSLDDLLTHAASRYGATVNGVASSVSAGADDTAVGTASVGGAVGRGINGVSSLGHAAAWTVGSITGSTTPSGTVVLAPASLAGEGCIVEAVVGRRTGTVDERSNANERDVVDYVLC